MTIEEIRKIREKVKCPQLDGTPEYGQWGALRLDQRTTIAKMCEKLEEMITCYDNPMLHSMHKYILDTHNFDDQVKHFYTEVFELTKAVYNNEGKQEIKKELADCYNFLDQIALHYGIYKEEITPIQIEKSKRTIDEMKGIVRR
jgi:NTP pyrophosphatase (non-canonical NTP hydrolase)